MKRIVVIFLCVFVILSTVVFFGCDSNNKSKMPEDLLENELDIGNDIDQDIDIIEDIGEGEDESLDQEPAQPALALSRYKVQATTTVNIRSQASSSSQVLGQLNSFDTLPLIAKAGNWYQVYYNNTPAYVSASYANLVEWSNHTDQLVTGLEVQALTTVNIRQEPSSSSAVLGKLNRLEHLPLVAEYSRDWREVIYQGKKAYVSANPEYTRVFDPEKNKALIDNIIAEGKKVLGVPYEYGAQRLHFNGKLNPKFTGKTFDCSSFVQYAFYMGANIILQADSRSQSREGILIHEHELEAGDLIFMWSSARRYNTGIERIGHVVIYIGDNKILHTWGTGGVRIQEYSSGWRERFILARRML